MLLTCSAGCIINDLTDRNIDAHVQCTRTHPLTSGEVGFPGAFTELALSMGGASAVLLSLNAGAVKLGLLVTPLVFLYSRTKCFFPYPQLILGLTFSSGVPIAQAVLLGAPLLSVALPLYCSAVLCILYYDSVYAFPNIRDDRTLALRSSAIQLSLFCEARRQRGLPAVAALLARSGTSLVLWR